MALDKNILALLFPALQNAQASQALAPRTEPIGANTLDDRDSPVFNQPQQQDFRVPQDAYSMPATSGAPAMLTVGGEDPRPQAAREQAIASLMQTLGRPQSRQEARGDDETIPPAPQPAPMRSGSPDPVGRDFQAPQAAPSWGMPPDAAQSAVSPQNEADDLLGVPRMPETARDKAKRKLEETINRKIENKDHGWKGRAMEGIANFLQGLAITARTQPNAGWKTLLAGGGLGAGFGFLDDTWNERRMHETELANDQRAYDLANQIEKDDNAFQNDAAERATRAYSAMTQRQKLIYDRLSDEKKAILDAWKEVDEFDPKSTDPNVQEIVKRAKELGVVVLPKKKGETFNFTVTPDGRLVIGNTKTGAYKYGEGNYARAREYTDKDLSPVELGIEDDSDIATRAAAAVGQEFPNRRVRPEVAEAIKNTTDAQGGKPYLNADGSLNETKAIADGIVEVDKLYENAPSNYSQRVAKKKLELGAGQKWKQAERSRFLSALNRNRPPDDADEKPFAVVKQTFINILKIKNPKERQKKLKTFYDDYLPSVRVN